MKQFMDSLAKFENTASLLTFIDMFGDDKGIHYWNLYQHRCKYSPLRMYKDLNDHEQEVFIEQLEKM